MRRIYLLILFVLCLSRIGQAEENNPFTVTGTYTLNDNILTITSDATVKNTDSATATNTCIVIDGGTEGSPLNITLDGININCDGETYNWNSAFALAANSHVKLVLIGTNTAIGSNVYAGLCVPETAVVEITAESDKGNELIAKCVEHLGAVGAGIGGNADENSGKIIISGGTVIASSDGGGAGIGGGGSGCGDVLIKGGDITATSESGAGIGNGYNSTGGTIVISGGTVKAEGKWAAGIGAGNSGLDKNSTCGSITITGGIVEAKGGYGASGIGNGYWIKNDATPSPGQITITGGEIRSKGGETSPSDIGCGKSPSYQKSNIKDLIIGPDATLKGYLRIQPDHYNGFVFQDGSATVCGEIELPIDITLDDGETLIIPDDAKLVVPSGKSLTFNEGATLTVEENGGLANEGLLQVNGKITGSGTISGPVSNKENETVFHVSFDLNGATGDLPVQLIKSGEKATAPTPVREYYTLEGWYDTKESAGGTAIEEKTITAATKFYARWSINDFMVAASSKAEGIYGDELTKDLNFLVVIEESKPCGTISFSLKDGNPHPLNLSLATNGQVTGTPDAATDTDTGTSVTYVATAANHVSHEITVTYKIAKRAFSIIPKGGQKLYEDEIPEYEAITNILANDEPLNDGELAKDGTHITQGTLDLTDDGKTKYTLDFTKNVEYTALTGKLAEVEATVPIANTGNWHKENIVLTAPEGFGISLQQPVPLSSEATDELSTTLTWEKEGLDQTISYILTRITTGATYNHSVSVSLDKTPPELAIDGEGLFYTLTAVDSLSGVKDVTIDDVPVSLLDGSYSAEDSPGSHTATVTDNAGNTTTKLFKLGYFKAENKDGVTIYYSITKAGPDENEVEVTSGIQDVEEYIGAMNIPDEITKDGITYKVTAIGGDVFGGCTGLTSLTMGDNVRSIGDAAFNSCTNLSSVTIGNGVTSVGLLAFANCTALTSVILGEKLVSIGEHAFMRSSLTEINIPASVSDMGSLFNLPTLKRISVAAGNQSYSSSDGILYSGDGKTLIRCPQRIEKTSILIPDKVTTIGNGAFGNCTVLTSITIAENVTTIEANAFKNCTDLLSVTLGKSLITIENEAFAECHRLKEIYNYSQLNLTVGDSGNGGIANYAKIIHTTEEESSIKEQGEYRYIVYTESLEKKIELFQYTGTATVLTLPESLQGISSYTIANHLFYNKNDITSVFIPEAVTAIGKQAFYCTGLESLTSHAKTPPVADDAFYDPPVTTTVYVPAGSIGSYKNAKGWKSFSSIKDLGPFSVSVNLNNSGMGFVDISATATPVDNKYYGGTILTLQARANSGYHFTGWSDDVTDATRTITVDKELTLQANFAVDYVPPTPDPTPDPAPDPAPDPVANETIETDHSRVWTAAGILHILSALDGKLSVYSINGNLKVLHNVHADEKLSFCLPTGVYIVRLGNKGVKVVL